MFMANLVVGVLVDQFMELKSSDKGAPLPRRLRGIFSVTQAYVVLLVFLNTFRNI